MIKTVFTVKKAGLFLGFIISLLSVVAAEASHLRAGQITVVRKNCSSREVIITIRVYTNTGSPVVFGGDGILNFGDGNSRVIEERVAVPRPELGPNIGEAFIDIEYTYGGPSRYTISYVEPNRNGGVLNMANSFYTTFYLETQIDLSVPNCSFPILTIPPIDQACTGAAFSHNPGAVDMFNQGDSLSYELAIPFRDRGLPVVNYRDPKDMSQTNEMGGAPVFSIDQVNGTLIWDAPSVPGEYNVAFHVNEWKKVNGIWLKIGYVRRDMQIIVNDDCTNKRPRLIVPNDTCVVAGSILAKEIKGFDPDGHQVKIQAFSEVFLLGTSPATRTPILVDGDGDFKPSPASIFFNWNTVCDHVKGQPYQVNFKITDKPTPGVRLATFETWQISVVAPAPVLTVATPIFPQRHVNLTWDSYECASNATGIQIWRKVGETSFVPGNCDTGMPESLGFTLVGTTSTGTATTFTDTNNGRGLEPGAQYCYRLVAIFREQGAESYVSNEICIDPIETSAPIITNVTVDETSATDGEITVKWIEPLDPGAYLAPYSYRLQRAQGASFENVSPIMQETYTFTDASALNTHNQQYTYRVLFYESGSSVPVDSSSLASSVWLDLTTGKQIINLDWSANVPWSNQIQGYVHDIYRGPEGATTLADLTPYVTVDAETKGMTFSDNGQAPLVPLDTTQTYCYAVITRGGYGNDVNIPPPLENVSQINCATPTVSNPPCKPTLLAQVNSCDEYSDCDATIFSNVIKWERNAGACNTEVRSYNIYRSTTQNGIYTRIETGWTDTFYVDPNLNSPARCYRISAVDRSNNEGELSDPVCIETCPYYELPNMFSPNGDGCNDLFSAYGVDLQLDENSKCKPDPNDNYKCARFVERVVFKVYNRWGTKVYEYTGQKNNENNIYINWNGRDSSGKELATAVYYYSADVTFDSTDPGGKVKTIKGWVHLMR